jgi:hypothetical protein
VNEEAEIASIVGSQIVGIKSDEEGQISWILSSGQILTFEGTFDIFLTKRVLN